jgi:hypothetical protein
MTSFCFNDICIGYQSGYIVSGAVTSLGTTGALDPCLRDALRCAAHGRIRLKKLARGLDLKRKSMGSIPIITINARNGVRTKK